MGRVRSRNRRIWSKCQIGTAREEAKAWRRRSEAKTWRGDKNAGGVRFLQEHGISKVWESPKPQRGRTESMRCRLALKRPSRRARTVRREEASIYLDGW